MSRFNLRQSTLNLPICKSSNYSMTIVNRFSRTWLKVRSAMLQWDFDMESAILLTTTLQSANTILDSINHRISHPINYGKVELVKWVSTVATYTLLAWHGENWTKEIGLRFSLFNIFHRTSSAKQQGIFLVTCF